MGYRNYFYILPKKITSKFQELDTIQDLIDCLKSDICKEWLERVNYQVDKDINKNNLEESYIPLYNICEKLYEFGKLYFDKHDVYGAITTNGVPLFKKGSKLAERFCEYEPLVVGKEAFVAVIKAYCAIVKDYYTNILKTPKQLKKEKPDDIFIDRRTVLEKLKESANEKLYWLNENHLNLDADDKLHITSSWLYEHGIFQLLHIYKTIDFDNYDIIEFGW